MKFGLEENIIEKITRVLADQPKVDKAYIFGSRSKGNYRPDSDIDIAIKGYDLTVEDILKMSAAIDKSGIKYGVDLVDYDSIKEEALREHIDRMGIEFYNRWKEYTLNEVYEFGSGLSKSADQFGYGYGFLSFKDIFGNYFIPDELINLVNSTVKEQESCSIKYGDVFLTRTSETDEDLGMSCVALKDYPKATFNGFTKRLRPKGKIEIDPTYAGFYFRSPKFRANVSSMSSVTTRASLNNGMLSQLKILVPPLLEQHAIADTLSLLRYKIDLLHRQNSTLESIAEVLFRQQFVENVDTQWNFQPLGQYVEIKRGGSPRPIHDFISDEGYNWLKISDVTNVQSPFISEIKEKIKPEGLNKTVLLKKGAIVLSNSATPGIPKILVVDSCIHDGWLYFPKSTFSREFLYLLFKNIRPELLQRGNGSIFTNLKTDILKEYIIPIADEGTLKNFDIHIKPIFKKLYLNTSLIKELTALRDELLPKLLSGEARIKLP